MGDAVGVGIEEAAVVGVGEVGVEVLAVCEDS